MTDHHVHRQAREGGGLVSGIELCEPDHREFDPEAARDVHWEEAGGDDDGVNLARIHGGAESTLSATSTQPGINNRGGVIIITVVEFTQKETAQIAGWETWEDKARAAGHFYGGGEVEPVGRLRRREMTATFGRGAERRTGLLSHY